MEVKKDCSVLAMSGLCGRGWRPRDQQGARAVEGQTLRSEAAMVPFAGLLAALYQIPDPRRRQGQRYSLAHLLLFAVLAILAGATSYRRIRLFIGAHRERLNATFGARSRRAPAVNTLRTLLHAPTRPRSRPPSAAMPSNLVTRPPRQGGWSSRWMA